MPIPSKSVVAIFFGAAMLTACSILQKEDPVVKVQAFLSAFQSDLSKTDSEILSKFRARQTPEAILTAVSVLQNKDRSIICDANYANARITIGKELIKVQIPILFRVASTDSDERDTTSLVLWLTPSDKNFLITQMDGDAFYQTYSQLLYRNDWAAREHFAEESRQGIYANARKLETQFDSVIWYSVYKNQPYFYVVTGPWQNFFLNGNTENRKNPGTKMGLVDASGNVIIPVEYDLIGSLGFHKDNIVEVVKDGKVGLFDVALKQMALEPVYDQIIPYNSPQIWALAKNDDGYGSLNPQFQFTAGVSDEKLLLWINSFEFLKQPVKLKPGEHTFCEIPSLDQIGNGIIVPPAYLSRNGVFNEIEGNISTTDIPMNGWKEYKETTSSFFDVIADNIQAVVTTVRERYLEGREEFYHTSTLTFMNDHNDTLHVATISGEEVSIHPIDSALLEVRTPHDYWFGEYGASDESNLYQHAYFTVSEGGIAQAKSNRLFAQTQFVKLDSSYVSGNFIVYNSMTEREEPTTFLSVTTLTYMRDEILASYGYSFPGNAERAAQFKQNGDWYKPVYSQLTEFETELSDIDRYNLAFLNRLIDPRPVSVT